MRVVEKLRPMIRSFVAGPVITGVSVMSVIVWIVGIRRSRKMVACSSLGR